MTWLKNSTVPDMVAQPSILQLEGQRSAVSRFEASLIYHGVSGQPQLRREILSQCGGVWCGEEECHGTYRVCLHICEKSGELHMLGHVAR